MAAVRKLVVDIVIVVERQPELLQIVLALRPAGGLACLLNGGEEQGDQDGDDCNHHQELDQCKATTSWKKPVWCHWAGFLGGRE